jgi:hypothetical protein
MSTTIDPQHLFHQRINTWLDTLTARAPQGYTYVCDAPRRGQRYVRVVMVDRGGARSVHAFYDIRTGDVYNAEGWKAPAKHVRYRLLDDASFTRMIASCDWSGGYLYLR